MKKKILSLLLALTMVIGVIPAATLAAFAAGGEQDPVLYYDWNEELKALTENYYTGELPWITSSMTELSGGWYIVGANTEINEAVEVDGDVHLILSDDCTLEAKCGILVPDGSSLSIYACSTGENMGTLAASGDDSAGAGIGAWNYKDWGDITIYGGNISASGGYCSAGIGGGEQSANGGIITIYGGKINAVGGDGGGAGIGGGHFDVSDYDYDDEMIVYEIYEQASAGTINIRGGEITARGGDRAAGIGGGYGGDCGSINISGGTVRASGGDYADGIGSGWCELEGAYYGHTDTLPVTGGSIKVTGGYIDGYIDTVYVGSAELPEGEPTKWSDNSWHVGYTKYTAKAPTCVESGNSDYYKDNYSGSYHADFPFADGSLIGGEEALQEWRSVNFKPLGHDWEYTDGDVHSCKRCTLTGGHEDADGDHCCDRCGYSSYYYEYNEATGDFDAKLIPEDAVEIDGDTVVLDKEWAIVTRSCTIPSRLYVTGKVHLILENGVTLTAMRGITVQNSIDIYAATTDESRMGKIYVPAENKAAGAGAGSGEAGIGGCEGDYGSVITINGGAFDVTGGFGGAAIGGGGAVGSNPLSPSEDSINCGNVTVYGGRFDNLTGGSGAAGIGSGARCYMDTLTIKGGTFTVINGGESGAGIGSGYLGKTNDIIITGGRFQRVSGGQNAAGIGAGESSYPDENRGDITVTGGNFDFVIGGRSGAAIGSSYRSKCGNITVTGGSFKSIWGNGGYVINVETTGAAGIGSGAYGHCGNIGITGGIFDKIGTFDGASGIGSGYYSRCGSITIGGGYFGNIYGGDGGPAVGGGAFLQNPMTVTITGGYIRAVGDAVSDQDAGNSAPDIGGSGTTVIYGENMARFSHAPSTNEAIKDPATYISPAKAPTCTEDGFKQAYIRQDARNNSGIRFFSSTVINELWDLDNRYLIGGIEELDTWLKTSESEGGGVLAAFGHTFESFDDRTHKCSVCGAAEIHVDADENDECDICGAAHAYYKCENCGGTGAVYTACSECGGLGGECEACGGEGKISSECPVCGGSGSVLTPVAFETMSLTLDGSLGINFFVQVNDLSALGDGARMEMAFDNFDGETLTVDFTDAEYDEAKGKYKFTFYVNSLQMAEEVNAAFRYGDGKSIVRTTSVAAYAGLLEKISENPKTVNVAKAILAYGYYAQLACQETNGFTLGDDGKYNAMEAPESVPDTGVDLSDYALSVSGSDENITALSMSLALENKTDICLYATAGTKPAVTGADVEIQKVGQRYRIVIPNIPAHKLSKIYTLNIGGLTVKVSALSYINSVLNSKKRSDNYKYAVASLYEYYLAALYYSVNFTSHNALYEYTVEELQGVSDYLSKLSEEDCEGDKIYREFKSYMDNGISEDGSDNGVQMNANTNKENHWAIDKNGRIASENGFISDSAETIQVRIVGINENTKPDGTKAGLTFMTTHVLKDNFEYDYRGEGEVPYGWLGRTPDGRCGVNGYLNNSSKTYFPAALADAASAVSVLSADMEGNVLTSVDKFWIPSLVEIFGAESEGFSFDGEGSQFSAIGGKDDTWLNNINKTQNGGTVSGTDANDVFTRSVRANTTYNNKVYVISSCGISDEYTWKKLTVCVCFCL